MCVSFFPLSWSCTELPGVSGKGDTLHRQFPIPSSLEYVKPNLNWSYDFLSRLGWKESDVGKEMNK